MPEIFLAQDFNNRQELETKVSSIIGLTPEIKNDFLIKGSRAELKRLQLGQGKVFWGIRCEEVDYQKPVKYVKVDRGKIHKPKKENLDIKGSE